MLKSFSIHAFILFFSAFSYADKPKLALIIDDIGNQPLPLKISTLPKEVSLAIIPFTKFDSLAAYQAHSEGREVMLHLPMQSNHAHQEPNTLTNTMPYEEFVQKVYAAIERIPYAVAVNNHMGSELTQQLTPMSWLMAILKDKSMGFIDSRTSPYTIAQALANEQGVANNRRHVFLDHEQTESFIIEQFNQAIIKASKTDDPIIIIGHPHDVTLQTLNWLLKIFENEIELVPISSALRSHPNSHSQFAKSVSTLSDNP